MTEYPVPVHNETATGRPDGGDQVSGSAKEKASQTAQTAADAGTQVAQTAKEQAKTVASEAGAQARDLAGEARDQLRDQAVQQHGRAVSGLRALADELRSMAENSQQSGVATEAVRQAAQRTHGAAEWLSDRQPGDLIDELRGLARRRPGTFLLGAAAAGILAGRLTRGVTSASSSTGTAGRTAFTRPAGDELSQPMPLAGTGLETGYGDTGYAGSGYGDTAYTEAGSAYGDTAYAGAGAGTTYTEAGTGYAETGYPEAEYVVEDPAGTPTSRLPLPGEAAELDAADLDAADLDAADLDAPNRGGGARDYPPAGPGSTRQDWR